jgi:hypothetical protein
MSDLKFSINSEEIAAMFGDLKKEVEEALNKGVEKLAAMTHAKVAELASENLGSTRKKYLDALDFKEVSPNVWVVSLDESALFIEDGRKSGSMIDDLLRNGAKVSKDGNRYRAIPFEHSKPKSQQGPKARDLTNQIRSALKSENIPYKKIEYNADGSPRVGKLHSLNIPSAKPSAKASHPALSGVTIYQTKTASGSVRRDIMTFRIVSDKQKEEGKWFHPGLEAKNFMDKAFNEMVEIFEREIMPQILETYK